MNIKITRLNFMYIIFSIVLCVCTVERYINMGNSNYKDMLNYTAMIGLIQIILCIIIWKKHTGKFISLFLFYLLSYYIFTMGQSLLQLFGIEFKFANIYMQVNEATMIKAHVFTIFCIAFLFEGALIAVQNKNKKTKKEKYLTDNFLSKNIIGQVGIVLFLGSVIPMCIYLGKLLLAYGSGGYAFAFESVSNSSGLMRIISKIYPFCVPSLVMIIVSYNDDRKKIAQIIMGTIGVLYFFIGERTGAASILLSLFILDSQLKESKNKKTSKSSTIKIILLVLALAVLIPAVGALRNSSDLSFNSLVGEVKEHGILAGITDTIATMGYSEFPLGKTMEIVPYYKNYAYGQSYFFALLAIFPNLIGGTHVSVKYAGLAQWLMNALHMSYGPGYSYPAEAWYNFGWFGCLFMFIIGYVFCKFMYIPSNRKMDAISLYISVAFFLQTVTSPRRELMTVIRLVGYYVFIPILLMFLLKSYAHKRGKANE